VRRCLRAVRVLVERQVQRRQAHCGCACHLHLRSSGIRGSCEGQAQPERYQTGAACCYVCPQPILKQRSHAHTNVGLPADAWLCQQSDAAYSSCGLATRSVPAVDSWHQSTPRALPVSRKEMSARRRPGLLPLHLPLNAKQTHSNPLACLQTRP
jgi:hypothetical protein